MARKVLHIDASARGANSESIRLTNEFLERWHAANPQDVIIHRDIVDKPLPHVDSIFLDGLMTPEAERTPEQQQAVTRSDELINEFLTADVLVLGVPMYNFGIPSTLKAWLDHISIAGRTFQYTATGPKGLVSNKPVYILSTRGGVYDDSPMEHQTSYLKTMFGFFGIEDIHIIQAQGLNLSPEGREKSITDAIAHIKEAVETATA